jgi:hypothetical protein
MVVFLTFFGDSKKPPSSTKRGKVNNVRCMVEYTKLDLITGAEKTIKITTQINILEFDIVSLMTQAIRNLADKITKLVNASKHNVLVNITEVSCKDRRFYSSQRLINSGHRWSEYKICEDEHNLYLLDLLDESSKIYNVIKGYNVHKDRLIKN